jgi:hypothetical protein
MSNQGTRKLAAASFLGAILLWQATANAQAGLASKYYRDIGIEGDPEVIFAENFETGTLADLGVRWTNVSNVDGMRFADEVPTESSGIRSLELTAVGGQDTGGHLYRQLSTGHNRLYLRYYVRYAQSESFHHCGGYLGGYNPPTPWPQGGAGNRPTGEDRFSIGAEPMGPSLQFDFYVYWMRMRGSPGGSYWGNDFIQDESLRAVPDQWMSVEIMAQMNDPVDGLSGELALWVDGNLVMHLGEGFPNGNWIWDSFHPDPNGEPFEGFQWRSIADLSINWIWLLHYVSEAPVGQEVKIWFDDVVLATSYIGPINASELAAPTGLEIVR